MSDSTIQVLEGILGNYGGAATLAGGLQETYAGPVSPVVATFQGFTDSLMENKWKILGGVALIGAAVIGWRMIKARRAVTAPGVAGYGRRSRKSRKGRKSRR